jgi:hypothetical protein
MTGAPGTTPSAVPEREQRGLPPGARGLRLAAAPTHSVILASRQPRAVLEARLADLQAQCRALGVELVVARSTTAAEFAELVAAYPYALFMPAPDGSSMRQLRAIGLTAADGDVVTLLEDDREVPARWVAEVCATSARAGG